MNKLPERLRELRTENNISQKKLADDIGTNNSSISDWENGRSEPSIDLIISLCRYFGVTSDYLLGLED